MWRHSYVIMNTRWKKYLFCLFNFYFEYWLLKREGVMTRLVGVSGFQSGVVVVTPGWGRVLAPTNLSVAVCLWGSHQPQLRLRHSRSQSRLRNNCWVWVGCVPCEGNFELHELINSAVTPRFWHSQASKLCATSETIKNLFVTLTIPCYCPFYGASFSWDKPIESHCCKN